MSDLLIELYLMILFLNLGFSFIIMLLSFNYLFFPYNVTYTVKFNQFFLKPSSFPKELLYHLTITFGFNSLIIKNKKNLFQFILLEILIKKGSKYKPVQILCLHAFSSHGIL